MQQFLAEARSIRAFIERAQPGETMVYARAASLPRGADAANVARAFAEQGVASLNLRRSGAEIEYLIKRRAEAPRRVTPRRGNGLGPLERTVLRLLKRYARTGRPIPTNRSIAARCGCQNRLDASWRIRKLIAGGFIAIETDAQGERRAIIPSGEELTK